MKLRRKELKAFRLLAEKYNVKVDDTASEVSSLYSLDKDPELKIEIIDGQECVKINVASTEEEKSEESKK